jgi:alkylation response protein AidB-like acyl-CoA dehydrogenase
MNFNSTDDRRMLSESLRRYLGDRYDAETRNRVAYAAPYHSPEHWQEMAELGILSALVTEAHGGFGGHGFDISVVFEEFGRALCPEPLLPSLLALQLLSAFNLDKENLDKENLDNENASREISTIVSGEHLAAVAIYEPQAPDSLKDINTQAVQNGDSWLLTGEKTAVYGGPSASLILVVAKSTQGLGLFIAQPSKQVAKANIDGGGTSSMSFNNAPATCIAASAQAEIERALDAGRLALCAEAIGVADVLLEMTVDYLKQRNQFGQVIASFQALQHRIVDMAAEIEQARSITTLAAAKLDDEGSSRTVALAKNLVGRMATLVAEESTQLHGGIGMTWEYAGSHYAKRLIMLDHQLGDRYTQVHRLLQMPG